MFGSRSDPADVNAFNDFYLINGIGKLKVRFNSQLQNLGQVALPRWLGVAQYSNHEILYDLQLGFQAEYRADLL